MHRRGHHLRRPGSGLRVAHCPQIDQISHSHHGIAIPSRVRTTPVYPESRNRSSLSINSIGLLDHMPNVNSASHPASRQATPSTTDRNVPAFTPTDTEVAQSSQQSSNPPSSTPPTPHNLHSAVHVEPVITTSRDGPSRRGSGASATIPTYYDYSEDFNPIHVLVSKDTTEILDSSLTTPQTTGFVQRVRPILEEKRMCDSSNHSEHFAAMNEIPEQLSHHDKQPHELPASPTVKRFTRDLIRSSLQPTSEGELTATPSNKISQSQEPIIFKSLTITSRRSGFDVANDYMHEKVPSKPSDYGSILSEYTSTAAALDCTLVSSSPNPVVEEGNTVSEFLKNYGSEDEHMTVAIEEHTQPATIATAEVDVEAPTPKQPRWHPNFQAGTDLLRPQSEILPSYVYSTSEKGSLSRYSTPLPTSSPQPENSQNIQLAKIGLKPKPESRKEISQKPAVVQSHSCSEGIQPVPPNESDLETRVPLSMYTSSTRRKGELGFVSEPSKSSSASRINANTEKDIKSGIVPAKELAAILVSPLSEFSADHGKVFSLHPITSDSSQDLEINNCDRGMSSICSNYKSITRRSDSPASINRSANFRKVDAVIERNEEDANCTDNKVSSPGLCATQRHAGHIKEEDSLEASISDLKAITCQFPLPQRTSSLADYKDFCRSQEPKHKSYILSEQAVAAPTNTEVFAEKQEKRISITYVPARSMTLDELRSIPSLQFSRVDLFSKLNEALDFYSDPSEAESFKAETQFQDRPTLTVPLRQKYRSFFESLDVMAGDPVVVRHTQNDLEAEQSYVPLIDRMITRPKQVVLPKIQQWTPDELMAEIDRMSIPSINGLTQRLSELLPSLRRYYGENGELKDDDETVRSALEEIKRLGAELIPRIHESDSAANEEEQRLLKGDGNFSRFSLERREAESIMKVKKRSRSASMPNDVHSTSLFELEALNSAFTRSRSLSHGQSANRRASVSTTEQSQASRRSLVSSSVESRPWNLDKSYPWANNVPSIDISIPAPDLRRDPIEPRLSCLRNFGDVDEIGDSAESICTENKQMKAGGQSKTFNITASHCRRCSRRSLAGSISRRFGLPRSTSVDRSGFATSPNIFRGKDRTVDPGDRYPTTGLSPPSASHIDEMRSFFSDDSSHLETHPSPRVISLRKRISNLKTKLPNMPRTHSALEQRPTPVRLIVHRSNSLFFAQITQKTVHSTGLDAHTDEASGMPKTEFRAKKLANRMKTLWYRGGELLRTLSGKRKPRNSVDWDDSCESTV
ncbi:uncharacterized protein PV09_05942 [Verruconis gallopava]|uniref:Uncharacterized protein n=1 Tax=Verruconis gallopava TaxID=253628 RepID=A0A0D1YQL5_9PEZI|nr:uncharacterized protein PV09_05942 [Verruconis gallopava]KIW02892.1 hypothetical protein PV09_05942 [Verruconis gallopava]